MKRSCAVLWTVVSLMLPTLAGGQARAEVERTPWGPDEVTGAYLLSCDGFDVLSDFVVSGQYTEYYRYDRSGSRELMMARSEENTVGQAVLYNSTDPSRSVLASPGQHLMVQWFFGAHDPRIAIKGPVWMVTIPGQGVVFAETGILLIDLTTGEASNAGLNQYFGNDSAALCDYLQ